MVGVRGRAAEALGRIGEKRLSSAHYSPCKDENSDVRMGAAEALGRIGGEKAIKPLITALAKDENVDVRWNAAVALENDRWRERLSNCSLQPFDR